MSPKRRARITQQIIDQQKWIEEHGGTRAGYRARYGVKGETFRVIPGFNNNEPVPAWYGNGGDAIFDADMGELRRLEGLLG